MDDTAWHPVLAEQAETWDPVTRFVLRTFLGSPLKLWASVGHWLIWHFDLSLYTEKQKPRVRSKGCIEFQLICVQICSSQASVD